MVRLLNTAMVSQQIKVKDKYIKLYKNRTIKKVMNKRMKNRYKKDKKNKLFHKNHNFKKTMYKS